MNKIKYIALILSYMSLDIQGQTLQDSYSVSLPKVIQSSPQSQLFEKYLNHQVTEYNGLPVIEIPLYEIEIKGLKIPITLSYHASGVKYKQYDGDIGVGWSINAGGYRVSRTVYGKPDDEYSLYSAEELSTINPYTAENYYNGQSYLGRIMSYSTDSDLKPLPGYGSDGYLFNDGQIAHENAVYLDGEYDLFNYMLPSTQGHFIISDRQTNEVFIAEGNQDRIILKKANNSISDIELTDTKGFIYKLGTDKESLLTTDPKKPYKTTGWLLSQIKSPFNESIDFSYKSHLPLLTRERNTTFHLSEAEISWDTWCIVEPQQPQQLSNSLMSEYGYWANNSILYVDKIESAQVVVRFIRDQIYSSNSDINGARVYTSSHVIREIRVETKEGTLLKKISFEYLVSPQGANTSHNETAWHRLLKSIKIGNETTSEKKYDFEYYASTINAANYYPDQWGYYAEYTGDISSYWKNLYLDPMFQNDRVLYTNRTLVPEIRTLNQLGNIMVFRTRANNNKVPDIFSLKKITYPAGGFTEYEYESNQSLNNSSETVKGGGLRISKITSQTTSNEKKIITKYKYGKNEDGNGSPSISHYAFSKSFVKENYHIYFREYNYNRERETFILCPFPFTDVGFNMARIYKTYSNRPFGQDIESFFKFSYPAVSVYQFDSDETVYNGKTISEYSIPIEIELASMYPQSPFGMLLGQKGTDSSNTSLGGGEIYTSRYRIGYVPTLQTRKIFDKNNQLIKKEDYSYRETAQKSVKGIHIKQRYQLDRYLSSSLDTYLYNHTYNLISSYFDKGEILLTLGTLLLESKVDSVFADKATIVNKESYSYDTQNRLIKTIQANSQNGTLEKEFTYPSSGALVTKNAIGSPIKTRTKHNNNWIGTIEQVYPSTAIQPSETRTSTGDGSIYRTDITYDLYDSKGNLRQITTIDGINAVYLWSYSGQYPVAEIKNATFATVNSALSSAGLTSADALSSISNLDNVVINKLKSLGNYLPNSLVSIYTYKPLVGILTATDPLGVTTYYDYDTFGRLKEIYIYKDNIVSPSNKQTVQKYDYHYQNQ